MFRNNNSVSLEEIKKKEVLKFKEFRRKQEILRKALQTRRINKFISLLRR